jgi:hypothetical protein
MISSPLPSFSDLYGSATSSMKSSALPILPSPMIPGFQIPNLEIVHFASEVQSLQMMTTSFAMIAPLAAFLNLDVNSIIPKIPGTSFGLVELMNGSPTALRSIAMQSTSLPYVPSQLYQSLVIPEIKILQTMSLIIKGYLTLIPSLIFGLISQVTSNLHISNMQSPPTIPDQSTIMNSVKNNGQVSGFPSIPSFPTNLFPSFSMPEIEMIEKYGIILNFLTTYCLSLLMNFCTGPLSQYIGFSFPIIPIKI